MLSSSPYTMLKLFKTSCPQKLVDFDCVTLYIGFTYFRLYQVCIKFLNFSLISFLGKNISSCEEGKEILREEYEVVKRTEIWGKKIKIGNNRSGEEWEVVGNLIHSGCITSSSWEWRRRAESSAEYTKMILTN